MRTATSNVTQISEAGDWFSMADAVVAFVAEHGHRPAQGNARPEEEIKLARWLSHQRTNVDSSPQAKERIAYLDSVFSDWRLTIYDERWQKHARELAAFVKEHNAPPSQTSPSESGRTLHSWLHQQRQRQKHNKNAWTAEREAQLDALVPGWSEIKRHVPWEETANRCAEFVAEHSRFPSRRTAHESERALGDWLHTQRTSRKTRKATWTPEREEHLDALMPGRTSSRTTNWMIRADEVAAFVEEHGRLPRDTQRDPHQAKLAKWLIYQRAKSLGKHPGWQEDRRAILDVIAPGWEARRRPGPPTKGDA